MAKSFVETKNREAYQRSVFLHPADGDGTSTEVPNGTQLQLLGNSPDNKSYLVKNPQDGQTYCVKMYHVFAVAQGSFVTLQNREAHKDVFICHKGEGYRSLPNGTQVKCIGKLDEENLAVEFEGKEYQVKKHHTVMTGAPPPPVTTGGVAATGASKPMCKQGCGRATDSGFASCCRTCEQTSGKSHGPGCDAKNLPAGARVPEPSHLAGAPSDGPKVYMCCQQTANAVAQMISWSSAGGSEIKASMPTFNKLKPGATPAASIRLKEYDIPVFGPLITRATMAMFAGPVMQEEARKLNITIPAPKMNQVVQRKMSTVRLLINDLRINRKDENAIRKIEGFVNAIELLPPGQIRNDGEWTTFIHGHCAPGWEDRLHVDVILTNFGLPADLGVQLKSREDMNRALRWLSKAFEAYGIQGSLCDVVNLVYAMLPERPAGKPGQAEVVKAVEEFNGKFQRNDFVGLWVPTHLVMDCEVDDVLAWLLLSAVHTKSRSALKTLAQLPLAKDFDTLEPRLSAVGVKVFRDNESLNADAVKLFWFPP